MTATATATETAKTISSITMQRGFEQIIISMVERTNDLGSYYSVEGVGIYRTSHGGQVGETAVRHFNGLETTDLGWGPMKGAREYANGWFADLAAKGWKRVS